MGLDLTNVMTKVQNPRHNSLKQTLDADCTMHCLTIVAQCTCKHLSAIPIVPGPCIGHRVSVVSMVWENWVHTAQ